MRLIARPKSAGSGEVLLGYSDPGRVALPHFSMRASLALIICAAIPCAAVAGSDYTQIGIIPAKCPITVDGGPTPNGFRITPQQAVEQAAKHAPVKCNSIFEQAVYADTVNYYIIKPVFGPMSVDADAVVVDGKSGRVTVRKAKQAHAQASIALECPRILATKVLAEKHPGWSIYDNDPLRLTGADIEYTVANEDATLNPDEVHELNDANLSIVQVFRLKAHRSAKEPSLVCHYGVHAQLSRAIPQQTAECRVVQRRQFGPEQSEFEASCR